MREYIVRIEDDDSDFDEMFIGGIRKHSELIRCKDCKWADWYTAGDGRTYWYCYETGKGENEGDDFCSQAEREEE